jgi:hypothetical protein
MGENGVFYRAMVGAVWNARRSCEFVRQSQKCRRPVSRPEELALFPSPFELAAVSATSGPELAE